MVSRPRTIGVAFVALLVTLSGGPALVGGTTTAATDDAEDVGEPSATLQNVQVGTLELENVTIQNATIEELTVQQLAIQSGEDELEQQLNETGENQSAENQSAGNQSSEVLISNVAFESLSLENVTLDELGGANESTAANETGNESSSGLQQVIDEDASSVMVQDMTIESMNADQLTIDDLTVEEGGDDGGILSGISDAVGDLFGGGGDGENQTATDGNESAQEIESLTVEQFDVGDITFESMTVGTLESQQADNATSENATENETTVNETANETTENATVNETAANETTADGNETATGEIVSSVSAGAMTVENSSVDTLSLGETQGLEEALGQPADGAANETNATTNETGNETNATG